jgi:hypothetical protein
MAILGFERFTSDLQVLLREKRVSRSGQVAPRQATPRPRRRRFALERQKIEL